MMATVENSAGASHLGQTDGSLRKKGHETGEDRPVASATPSRSRKREPPARRPAAQLTTGECRPGRPAHEPNRFRRV